MCDWRRPSNLGVANGRLAACRRTPNCVSSQAERSDAEHYIAPIVFKGRDAMSAVKRVVASMPRTTVIEEKPNYLYAEFRSRLFRYVDDVEFYHDAAAGLIHVRSASRLGRSDLGVNRRRIEEIRARLGVQR